MRSVPSIAFDARPSPTLAYAAAIGVVAAIVTPWQSALPTIARVAASAVACAAGVVALTRFERPRFARVAHGAAGWTLVDPNGEAQSAELVAHRRLGTWLALDFRDTSDRRFRIVLGPDNSDAETRRRLALMLSRAEIARPAEPV
jgi:hypothetical protein